MLDQTIDAAVDRIYTKVTGGIEDAVAAGVRKATTPAYFKTADACAALAGSPTVRIMSQVGIPA